MKSHNIYRECCGCRIRPLLEADEQDVLCLWNQEWVIGNLWTSHTSVDTYRSCFKLYEDNPDVYQCVVEKQDGEFVGTIGFSLDSINAKFGFFALYPNRGFPAGVPCILLFDYILNVVGAENIVFTCNVFNEKAKAVYRRLGAELTGEVDTMISQYGVSATREHWKYNKKRFNDNLGYFKTCFNVDLR